MIEKYNKIQEKVKNSMKNGFDSEPVHWGKYLKTKIKSYEGKINTYFHGDNVPNVGFQCICLTTILNNYFQNRYKLILSSIFRREYKYIFKEKKMPKYIADKFLLKNFL